MLAFLWRSLVDLIRDLAGLDRRAPAGGENEQPQSDDLLDASFDEDGMDATGL